MKKVVEGEKHKSERTDAASASLYSYPRDSNPRAAYKKLQKENFEKLYSPAQQKRPRFPLLTKLISTADQTSPQITEPKPMN